MTKRVSICDEAANLLGEMASAQGVSTTTFLHALLHYAGSVHRRPGSWEANQPFEFATYDDRTERGKYADRWFREGRVGR